MLYIPSLACNIVFAPLNQGQSSIFTNSVTIGRVFYFFFLISMLTPTETAELIRMQD